MNDNSLQALAKILGCSHQTICTMKKKLKETFEAASTKYCNTLSSSTRSHRIQKHNRSATKPGALFSAIKSPNFKKT